MLLSILTAFLLTPAPAPAFAVVPSDAPSPGIVARSLTDSRFPLPRFPFRRRAKRAAEPTPMALVDRRLRLLVVEQETWYAQQARYGRDVAKLSRPSAPGDSAMQAVQIEVIHADTRGWTAIASHPSAPGRNCVVYVGFRERLPWIPRTRAEAFEARDEGRPTCDR